tara:strand:- start:94 stop:465 length:372 start_codon:yes stop_codon:yes gene_type:complete
MSWLQKQRETYSSPAKHCGCGIIGPKKIGYNGQPSPLEKRKPDVRKTTKGKGRNFRTVEEGAGMTKKGVENYRKKNPGSKLKTAVTGKVKPGSKAAKRRKSFCARSKGWTSERGRAARRRWKC